MANNRMSLRCTCGSTSPTIAKFYPSTGWYRGPHADALDLWLGEHRHDAYSSFGPTFYTLAYETDGDEARGDICEHGTPFSEECPKCCLVAHSHRTGRPCSMDCGWTT